MKILAPVNDPNEVKKIIQEGADELYCGVLSDDWQKKYTNIASPNRREWKTANLPGFNELKEVVDIAHGCHVPVYLTLNTFYSKKQYPFLLEQVEAAKEIGLDALIIADMGLLLTLKKEKTGMDIHIGTGGTTFNSETVKFYEDFGVSRIVLPRHLQVREIEEIVKDNPSMQFEVFILNSGCKNIDGFCTFQHGISEFLHGSAWNIPKKLNFDRHLLNAIRRLPLKIARGIKSDVFGIDSACLLNYRISYEDLPPGMDKRAGKSVLKNIGANFNLLYGADTCGACRLAELEKAGVYGVKIVGRNYSTVKKVQDVKFLKATLVYMKTCDFDKEEFYKHTKEVFKKIYGMKCGNLCYYPDGM